LSKKLIKCPTCGSEVAKGVKICPHCGAKMDKYGWLKKLLIIGFIGYALFAFMEQNSKEYHEQKKTEMTRLLSEKAENVNPLNVIRSFESSGLSLQEKEKKEKKKKASIEKNFGKIVKWSMEVSSVEENNGDFEITVGRPQKRTIMLGIEPFADVILDKKYASVARNIRPNDKIVFKGFVKRGGFLTTYKIEPAILLSVNGKKIHID